MEEEVLKAGTIFSVECQSVLPRFLAIKKTISGTGDREHRLDTATTTNVFLSVWEKFSQVHKSSPSRLNNNISFRCNRQGLISNDQEGRSGGKNDELKPLGQHTSISTTVDIKVGWHNFFLFFATILKAIELLLILLVSIMICYGIIVLHRPTQAFISRNTQDLIYPLMRGLRLITLPVIRTFPRLTEVYEESCLITNSRYFTMNKVECWPCEEAKQVIDLTGLFNSSSIYYYGGIPFVIKQNASASESHASLMERIYAENMELLSSVNLASNINGIRTLQDVFPINQTRIFARHENLHIAWKINKVVHTRILRKYFSKPYFIPAKTEVSIQHFLLLDNFKSSTYSLPFTEFANVFLHQAGGRRHLVLVPTETCMKTCKVRSVVLQHGDVLFYNWLYWRPKSVPLESSSLISRDTTQSPSITYMGSFY